MSDLFDRAAMMVRGSPSAYQARRRSRFEAPVSVGGPELDMLPITEEVYAPGPPAGSAVLPETPSTRSPAPRRGGPALTGETDLPRPPARETLSSRGPGATSRAIDLPGAAGSMDSSDGSDLPERLVAYTSAEPTRQMSIDVGAPEAAPAIDRGERVEGRRARGPLRPATPASVPPAPSVGGASHDVEAVAGAPTGEVGRLAEDGSAAAYHGSGRIKRGALGEPTGTQAVLPGRSPEPRGEPAGLVDPGARGPGRFTNPLNARAREAAQGFHAREPQRAAPAKAAPPLIEVTIGRLEIRSAAPAAAVSKPKKAFAPHLDLNAYRARKERRE